MVFQTGHATTGKVTGTVTAVNSPGTNAVGLHMTPTLPQQQWSQI